MARMQAGKLRDRITVLSFEQGEAGWSWQPLRPLWADAVLDAKPNIFSNVGVGERGVTFTIRETPWLSLHHAFRWKDKHCFLTSIIPSEDSPGYVTAKAALVTLMECEDKLNGMGFFPAVLVEKYVRFEEPAPHSTNTVTCVLVTPKQIWLKPGKPVEVGGITCPVRTIHPLDQYKNEYEIERKFDL